VSATPSVSLSALLFAHLRLPVLLPTPPYSGQVQQLTL